MSFESGPDTVRPPVFLGCLFAVAVVVAIAGIALFAITFLESGANTGEVQLDVPEAYAPGSVQFISAENLYLVRLPDGDFLALADMDAANRTAQSRRCRVALLPINDAVLSVGTAALQAQVSPDAAGATVVFREPCFGAIYDIAGIRVGSEGPNLDRYTVRVDGSGRIGVDTRERQCSQHTTENAYSPTSC